MVVIRVDYIVHRQYRQVVTPCSSDKLLLLHSRFLRPVAVVESAFVLRVHISASLALGKGELAG
jgi:hypothetical protein